MARASPLPLLSGIGLVFILHAAMAAETEEPTPDASLLENSIWSLIDANRHNKTALGTIQTAEWVSSSELRGTMAILQSCILTLIACVYTVQHPNIPGTSKQDNIMFIIRMFLFSIAVIGPELITALAAYQFFSASKLSRQLKDLQKRSAVVDKEFDFSLKYAFFVLMGGLRVREADLKSIVSLIDADRDGNQFVPSLRQDTSEEGEDRHFLLNPDGIVYLASRDIWIYVPPHVIDRTGKSSVIQKSLVLFQVCWFVFQCITRTAYGLPLAVLEVHTLAHVALAVAVQCFWIKKPYDVVTPTIVTFDESWLGAFSVMLQSSFYRAQAMGMKRNNLVITPNKTTPIPDGSVNIGAAGITTLPNFIFTTPARTDPTSHEESDLASDISRTKSRLDLLATELSSKHGPPSKEQDNNTTVFNLLGLHQDGPSTGRYLTLNAKEMGNDIGKIAYWPTDVSRKAMSCYIKNNHHFFLAVVILSIVTSGLHLTVWDLTFPTEVERLIWKIAALSSGLAIPVVGAIGFMVSSVELPASISNPSLGEHKPIWRLIYIGVLILLFGIPYCYGRAFILFESFISLRKVAIGVFWTPSWLQMIPHF